jgi:hypothetical protein
MDNSTIVSSASTIGNSSFSTDRLTLVDSRMIEMRPEHEESKSLIMDNNEKETDIPPRSLGKRTKAP